MLSRENDQVNCGFGGGGNIFPELNADYGRQTVDGLSLFELFSTALDLTKHCIVVFDWIKKVKIRFHTTDAKLCENKMNCLVGDSNSNSADGKWSKNKQSEGVS